MLGLQAAGGVAPDQADHRKAFWEVVLALELHPAVQDEVGLFGALCVGEAVLEFLGQRVGAENQGKGALALGLGGAGGGGGRG